MAILLLGFVDAIFFFAFQGRMSSFFFEQEEVCDFFILNVLFYRFVILYICTIRRIIILQIKLNVNFL